MAASTVVILSVLLLFFLAQKTFLEGIATEGVEGMNGREAAECSGILVLSHWPAP
jgi:hypothetical protein